MAVVEAGGELVSLLDEFWRPALGIYAVLSTQPPDAETRAGPGRLSRTTFWRSSLLLQGSRHCCSGLGQGDAEGAALTELARYADLSTQPLHDLTAE